MQGSYFSFFIVDAKIFGGHLKILIINQAKMLSLMGKEPQGETMSLELV